MPVRELSVCVSRQGSQLQVLYRLEGDLDALRLPEPSEARRTDELWRHTCFEAFVRPAASETGYCEYNFSPSGAWAAYQFTGYRADMRNLGIRTAPEIDIRREKNALTLAGTIDARWTRPASDGALRLGVTAVIEDRSGLLSYWALKHPPGKADFHHADGFVLDVS